MSATPNKPTNAATGPAEGKASPNGVGFTEREQKILLLCWQCLRSGPPEIDIKKLVKVGGFNTEKTASNTWGALKKKLTALAAEGNAESESYTPKDTPKKRVSAGAVIGETPTKKSRKTPVKNECVKDEED